jgi:K+-transporting ATPase ATPase A chain
VDVTRSVTHILLPLSVVLALLLVSQGVVQTLAPYRNVSLLSPFAANDTTTVTTQTLAVGPVASQIAIKQLGTNGGGFYNVNSAHPFENPTPFSNFSRCLRSCSSRRRCVSPSAPWCATAPGLGDPRRDVDHLCSAAGARDSMPSRRRTRPVASRPGHAPCAHRAATWKARKCASASANSALWATATTAASNGR